MSSYDQGQRIAGLMRQRTNGGFRCAPIFVIVDGKDSNIFFSHCGEDLRTMSRNNELHQREGVWERLQYNLLPLRMQVHVDIVD